jgi:DNA-binding MarR family transcriptional regulator
MHGKGEDQLLREAEHLAALPGYSTAVREYTLGLARFREAPRLINKLISYERRFRVLGYLLYLQADREKFGPEGGATYGRLHELCTRRQEVSPRVLKTTLALLRLSGFVTTRRSETDRRSKFYRPTERMYDFVRQWLAYATGALDHLQPEVGRARLLREDPDFIDRFLVSGGRDHIVGEPPADRMPDFIAFFGSREGAFAVIIAVALAAIDGTPMPSRAAIARRFGLSKSQVTSIIAEGAARGYFTVTANGVPAETAHLNASYRRWISIELAFYARHMAPAA